jgi:hypothetical protein
MTGALCRLHAACAAVALRCEVSTARSRRDDHRVCKRVHAPHLHSDVHHRQRCHMSAVRRWDRLGHAVIGAADLQRRRRQHRPRRLEQQQQPVLRRLPARHVCSTGLAAWRITCQARGAPAATAAARSEQLLARPRLLCPWVSSSMVQTAAMNCECEIMMLRVVLASTGSSDEGPKEVTYCDRRGSRRLSVG